MWLFYSLLSGIFFTISGLLARYTLKGDKDAWAFSFYYSFIGALTSLPFVIISPTFSQNYLLWALIIVVGFLIVLHNFLNFRSTNYLEASIQGSLTKLRLLWIMIIGLIFLGESLNFYKIFGTLLTIAAGFLIFDFESAKKKSRLGVVFALSATLVFAIVIALYKFLFAGFNSVSLTFLIFAIPALINFSIMPNAIKRISNLFKFNGKSTLLAAFFGALANLSINHALSIGEASRVLVISEAFLIVLLFGEGIFLKENKNFVKKLIAVILATLGAMMIRFAK